MRSSHFPCSSIKALSRLCVPIALVACFCSDVFSQTATKLLPFQGRLTDQNGVAVADGAKLVQFKIYDVPAGGAPVWAGELHRTTVNGGLVNVLLGSKTPFAGVDFDKTLYLEITVDVSGPGGQPDGSIAAADPPMLPRQIILPAVFAKESADSRKLAGYDWTPIFGTNSPAGPLPATKLAPGSITAAQLAPNTITSNQIAPGSIAAGHLAPGAVGSAQIQDGAVFFSKLAPRQTLTNRVGVGGIAVGELPGDKVTTSADFTTITNLTVTITTIGRPVHLMLVPMGNSAMAGIAHEAGTSSVQFRLRVVADQSRLVGDETIYAVVEAGSGTTRRFFIPASSFQFVDFPAAGTHTYEVQFASAYTPSHTAQINSVRLVVYEL